VKDQSDTDAQSDSDIFQECADRLLICDAAESENRIRGLQALQFRDGSQWDADIANARKIDNRPALTINHTDTFCARVENTLKQQRPRIKVHPVGGGVQVEDAKVVNGLIRHIEVLSNSSIAYDTGGVSAINIGWGYWRIISEYCDSKSFDQELKIKPIRNTFTVYMDPTSVMPAGEDQQWCILTEKMKRREYKRKYPKAENSEWKSDGAGDDSLDWESKEEIRLAEYYRIHEVNDVLYRLEDGNTILKSELPAESSMAQAEIKFAVDRNGQPVQRETTRKVVQWFRLNGKKVVDRREIPGRFIPVIRCQGNVLDLNGKVKRKGMVENLMDPARMFNYWRTAQTERYALAPKAPWVVAEGQIEGQPEWHSANQKAYSVLVYKPIAGPDGNTMIPPPQRQAPAQVEAGMSEAASGAEHDLMAVAGMPQENPEISARVVSGNKYLSRRQGMQDLTHFQYYDNQTLAIMWTGLVLLEQIPYFYDTERMQRIIGDDGVPQMTKINERVIDPQTQAILAVKNNLKLGQYDIVMDTGPGYQTKREEGTEQMMELLQTPLGESIVKVGSDLIVRNMDFSGADDLADRLVTTTPDGMQKAVESLPKQAQAIVGALQQQIQGLQDTIKQQALEIKYKATIEEAKVHAGREKAHMDDETKRHGQELVAHTSLAVAGIHGATQLLNTNTEASHDRRAARELIDNAVDNEKAASRTQ
jgi:Phage P22-like portal protein